LFCCFFPWGILWVVCFGLSCWATFVLPVLGFISRDGGGQSSGHFFFGFHNSPHTRLWGNMVFFYPLFPKSPKTRGFHSPLTPYFKLGHGAYLLLKGRFFPAFDLCVSIKFFPPTLLFSRYLFPAFFQQGVSFRGQAPIFTGCIHFPQGMKKPALFFFRGGVRSHSLFEFNPGRWF